MVKHLLACLSHVDFVVVVLVSVHWPLLFFGGLLMFWLILCRKNSLSIIDGVPLLGLLSLLMVFLGGICYIYTFL